MAEQKKASYFKDGQLRERRTKSQGITKGREPGDKITKRREIIEKIFAEYESITMDTLLQELHNEFKILNSSITDSKKKYIVPTAPTVTTDLQVLGLSVARKGSESIPKDNYDDNYDVFFEKNEICKKEIFQIRVTAPDLDIVLYPLTEQNKSGKKKKRKDELTEFYMPINQYRKNNNKEHDKKLAHVYIIFYSSGLESYVGDVFLDNCEYVLYTTNHNRCVEITTIVSRLMSLLKCVYYLIK